MMIVKQAKLANGLHGETSNILNETQFHMVFDNHYLTVTHKNPDKAKTKGPFIVFSSNIAYLVPLSDPATVDKKKSK